MRINYLNSLRLLATLSVVFLHTSARLLDAREITNLDTQFGLSCYKYTMQFGVPVFIMISGALFLNPSKEVGFGLFGRKYVKRIVSALVIFGLPMCLIETYFSKQGGGGAINSIIHFATGHSWAHMWYLYMLIGLYLITPVIKPFVVKASNKDWLAALGLFVCPVIIIPDFECRGSWIDRVYDFFHSLFVYLFVGILVVLENSTKDLWEQNASDCNHYPMYWDYYHEMLL